MKKLLHVVCVLLAGVLLAAGCGNKSSTGPEPAKPVLTTFANLKTTLFTPICARSGCHGTTSTQSNLVLTADRAYASLVDVPSVEAPSLMRVKPFDSANSFLIRKLNGTGVTFMPPEGKLTKAKIDSVAAWINRGAVNN